MILKYLFIAVKFIAGVFFKKESGRSYLFTPVFTNYHEMIDQLYRITWYYPGRINSKILIQYNSFDFTIDDLRNENNRPWYMHSLPINIENVYFVKQDNIIKSRYYFYKHLLMDGIFLRWNNGDNVSIIHQLLINRNIEILIDHKIKSYQSDINYVRLMHGELSKEAKAVIIQKSRNLFTNQVISLRNKYKKVYIFGRGPSLSRAHIYDFSDGVRIVSNQTVRDLELMRHISPHFITACDHAYHYGCSKLADYFRNDLYTYLMNNNVYFLLPIDVLPLFEAHYPELADKIIGVPYTSSEFNIDLLAKYAVRGSVGILHEMLIPVGCTIADEVLLLGFDGKSPNDNSDRVWTYAKNVDYPQDIIETIHGSRPGYYTGETGSFENLFESELYTLISKVKNSGKQVISIEKSYHKPLQ